MPRHALSLFTFQRTNLGEASININLGYLLGPVVHNAFMAKFAREQLKITRPLFFLHAGFRLLSAHNNHDNSITAAPASPSVFFQLFQLTKSPENTGEAEPFVFRSGVPHLLILHLYVSLAIQCFSA